MVKDEIQNRILFGMATNLAHAKTIAKQQLLLKEFTDIEFHAELALERSKFLGQYQDDLKNFLESYELKETLMKEEEEKNKLKDLL